MMLKITLIVLAWVLVMTLVLAVLPDGKIKVIGDFFKKVLPSLPITGIIKILRGK